MGKLYREFEVDTPLMGLPVVGLISGFTDSGSTVAQLSEHLFANLDHQLVYRFNNDDLLDYRSRRPTLYFEKDHIESYEPPSLAFYLMWDEAEQPFLLLEGYEPDFRWESFVRFVTDLFQANKFSSFTWVHAIPFPIPHTRPTGITVSGNRHDMISRFSEWKPETQVPGNVVHLLEYRLGEIGIGTAGFVMLVPHYLADNEVPKAALSGLELISAATGLIFPSDELRDRILKFEAKVNQQVQENAELAKLIATLEQSYGSGETGPARAPIGKPQAEPPSADQIADELEKYLANMRRNEEKD
jgi:hypothetical protein